MNTKLRSTLALVAVAAFALLALRPPMHAAEPAPAADAPVLHEWGVFGTYDDVELANADMKAEWDALPKFVNGRLPGRLTSYHGPVAKPVIYVHAGKPTTFDLTIGFPGGAAAVWWPAAAKPTMQESSDDLQWKVHAGAMPEGRGNPKLRDVPADHWMSTLRKSKASPVFSAGSYTNAFPGQVWDREQFLYYDGVLPAVRAITIVEADGKVTVSNTSTFAVHDVYVIDRRTGRTKAATIDTLGAGAKATVSPADADAAQLTTDLAARVKAAGLFDEEADHLAKIWRKEFFEGEGLTAVFRLPQSEYDKRLPAKVTPAPKAFVRVGLVHYKWTDPTLAAKVAELVKQFDADEFRKREAAEKALAAMGKPALAHLWKQRAAAQSAEVRSRLTVLLSKFEADLGVRKP